jgi:hypothetical protein
MYLYRLAKDNINIALFFTTENINTNYLLNLQFANQLLIAYNS